jgi:hypothetical protein
MSHNLLGYLFEVLIVMLPGSRLSKVRCTTYQQVRDSLDEFAFDPVHPGK